MVGGNRLCIPFRISIFFVCINVLHRAYFVISYSYAIVDASSLYDTFGICICLGELHLKSLSYLFVITQCVLSSSKRGRLLAQRPLALVDDNKTYVIIFLTISFSKVLG